MKASQRFTKFEGIYRITPSILFNQASMITHLLINPAYLLSFLLNRIRSADILIRAQTNGKRRNVVCLDVLPSIINIFFAQRTKEHSNQPHRVHAHHHLTHCTLILTSIEYTRTHHLTHYLIVETETNPQQPRTFAIVYLNRYLIRSKILLADQSVSETLDKGVVKVQ